MRYVSRVRFIFSLIALGHDTHLSIAALRTYLLLSTERTDGRYEADAPGRLSMQCIILALGWRTPHRERDRTSQSSGAIDHGHRLLLQCERERPSREAPGGVPDTHTRPSTSSSYTKCSLWGYRVPLNDRHPEVPRSLFTLSLFRKA